MKKLLDGNSFFKKYVLSRCLFHMCVYLTGLNVISMKEFLETEAITGRLGEVFTIYY